MNDYLSYNLAFLTFEMAVRPQSQTEITQFINTGIDTPLMLTKEEDRPLWKWIQENEGYHEKYHDALRKLIETCHDSGRFEKRVDELSALLRPYVEKDPSAFYDVQKFDEACRALKLYDQYRSASILKQLNGELSTRNETQRKEDLVDASELQLSDMQ